MDMNQTAHNQPGLCQPTGVESVARQESGHSAVYTISDLEDRMVCSPANVDLEPVHHFTEGLYARELFVPAGVLTTTLVYKQEHMTVLLQGRITIYDEKDDSVVERTAPGMWITKPGSHRAIYHHEDTRIVTFHPAETDRLEELEKQIIEDHSLARREQLKEAMEKVKEIAA